VSPQRYDAIIIGSGAGGAAAAYRLTHAGLHVLVLEKGGHLPTDGSTLDFRRVVHQGEFLSREPWIDGRGRALAPEEHFNVGGKTKWYGAALLRFGEHEFEADGTHDCTGWPIGYSDLEPYYREAERLLAVGTFDCEPDLARILASFAGRDGWQDRPMPMGLARNIAQYAEEAAYFDGFASVRGLKLDADTAMLSRLAGYPNFTLMPHAEVRSLIGLLSAPQTIAGVRLADGREFHAPRVLLAAGALHSPRLLSRYFIASGLDRELPAVLNIGRHLKLHLLTAMVSIGPRRVTDLIRKTTVLVNERFPHSSVQPLGFSTELIATLMPKALPSFARRLLATRAYGFFLQTEDGSDARNRVREDASSPVLDYDERRMPAALREHRAFTRALRIALLRAGLVSVTKRIGLNGTAHACGTLRCGHDPVSSVVDSRGAVHGMRGLYVVDGSVLPRSSRVNPSLSIFAWALRTADLLVRERAHAEGAPVGKKELIHVG
jgi:choline dehydrogenase-like flavoprotein